MPHIGMKCMQTHHRYVIKEVRRLKKKKKSSSTKKLEFPCLFSPVWCKKKKKQYSDDICIAFNTK